MAKLSKQVCILYIAAPFKILSETFVPMSYEFAYGPN